MSVPFLDLRAQYQDLKSEIDRAIADVIASSAFAGGPMVERFERDFAQFLGVKHCIGVNSGTSALTLLLRAHGIGPGDEVITVANSFFASAEAIVHAGAVPRLVDAEERTALMDPMLLERAITQKTKVVIPVHLYGQPADMEGILAIARKHRLLVFEDACQAHGAGYKGKKAGNLADAAAFSFYPGKNLGAYGEAGAVTTNDDRIAGTIRMLRDHGMARKYHHDLIGYNERMDGIQGAVLSVKLPHLDAWNSQRREHAERYQQSLQGIGDLRFFATLPTCEHAYHLFVIRTGKRDALQKHLQERGVATGIHYPVPIHTQKAAASFGYQPGDFPIAEKLAKEILSLPMYPELTEGQIEEVCTAIRAFFG